MVEVSSEPSGAEVWLPSDTEARGHTPFKVALDPNAAPTHAVLKARGYADKRIDIDPGKPEPLSIKLDASRENAIATQRHQAQDYRARREQAQKGEGKP